MLAAGSFQEGDRGGPCCAWDVPVGLMVRGAAGGRKRCRDVQVRLLGDKLIAFAFQITLAPVHAVHFDSEVALGS